VVVPLVQVESIGADVRREIEVGQPVVVDVADSNAASVVVLQISEDVERRVFGKTIDKCDASGSGGKRLEECRRGRRGATRDETREHYPGE